MSRMPFLLTSTSTSVAALIFMLSTSYAVPLENVTGPSDVIGRGGVAPFDLAVLPPGDLLSAVLTGAVRPGIGTPSSDFQQFFYLYQIANGPGPIHGFAMPGGAGTTSASFDSGNFRLDFIGQGATVNTSGLFRLRCARSEPFALRAQKRSIAGRTVSDAERVTVSIQAE